MLGFHLRGGALWHSSRHLVSSVLCADSASPPLHLTPPLLPKCISREMTTFRRCKEFFGYSHPMIKLVPDLGRGPGRKIELHLFAYGNSSKASSQPHRCEGTPFRL